MQESTGILFFPTMLWAAQYTAEKDEKPDFPTCEHFRFN